jgi:hypothetical protein
MALLRVWAGTTLLMCLSQCALGEQPVVFWASDPVRPGEAVVIVGHGLGDEPTVELARLPDDQSPASDSPLTWPEDGQTLDVLQASSRSLKVLVPAGWRPGVFAYRVTGPGGSALGMLNRPRVWWAQGDLGMAQRGASRSASR